MDWTIKYTAEARKQLKKLDKHIAKTIVAYLDAIDSENPTAKGKDLKGKLAGYRRYRIEDYRVICKLEDEIIQILVIRIGHRRDVYDNQKTL